MHRLVLALSVWMLMACGPETQPDVAHLQAVKPDSDWSTYLGDSGRSHYSPLQQINPDNVAGLEVAWVYESEAGVEAGTMYTSPVVVDGVLYGLSPSLIPFALNAATGQELWRTDLGLNRAAQRGLMWWQQGNERRLFFTASSALYALNADTGALVPSFGDNGKVDITRTDIPLERRVSSLSATVPGIVFEDKIILGFSTSEDQYAYPGAILAFSAIDGRLLWQFNTLPKPGEPGAESWQEGDLLRAGGANVWSGMALDEQRGLLFAPTGSATPDFYGGDRPGDNLFANSLVAVDARTGQYRWHYQVVRHDLWDKDNPSPPTLVQIERDGKLIDAVTLTTKTGHLYAFDRETGESLYPIIEVDTPIPSTLPGEVPAPAQSVSSIAISGQEFHVTERNQEATAYVKNQIKDWDLRPWAPPKIGTVLFYPWYDGGAEWGGSAYDPVNRRLIVNSNEAAAVLTLSEVPAGHSVQGTYATHCGACHGVNREGTDRGPHLNGLMARLGFDAVAKTLENGGNGMPSFAHLSAVERNSIYRYILPEKVPPADPPSDEVAYALTSGYVYLKDHEGLPGNAPPWGTLNSIDLDSGEIKWRVNFGNFLSHPELGFGALNYGGPVVTASGLIFIAATPDKMIRAYDAESGLVLWQYELNAAGFSTPAVYSVDGQQYVVIAAGGGRLGPPSGSDYVAFALPQPDTDEIEHNQLSAAEQSSGWQLLFDGRSLHQWRSYGEPKVNDEWQIEDDKVVLTASGGGDLITRESYANFELSLDWWVEEGGNSGIFFLADESDLPIYVHAPEVQILDDARHRDGQVANRRSGSLYDLIAAPPASQKPAGEWNKVKIRHQDGHVQVWQNHHKTADIVIGSERWQSLLAASKFADWSGFGQNRSGFIGLQDHGDRVAFRNIKIRPLVTE